MITIIIQKELCKKEKIEIDIHKWVNDNLEYCEESYISLSDIYVVFLKSKEWKKLNKADRRKYNKSNFYDLLRDILSDNIKERKKYKIENKYIDRPYLINYKFKSIYYKNIQHF